MPRMQNIVLDGLTAIEQSKDSCSMDYIRVFAPVDRLVLRDIMIVRNDQDVSDGHLLAFRHQGSINKLYMQNVTANGLKRLIEEEEKIEKIYASNVTSEK